MRAVFGVVEHLASLSQHGGGELLRTADGPVFSEEVDLAPIFPGLERFAVDLDRKPNAETLLEMEPCDHHTCSAGKIRPVLPQRAIAGLVVNADSYRFYRSRLLELFWLVI